MKAIQTKFMAPTNTNGSRIKVFGWGTKIFVNWDYALGVTENHHAAIATMVDHLNQSRDPLSQWGLVAIANSPDEKGYIAIIDLIFVEGN